jgi:hypothetical protein
MIVRWAGDGVCPSLVRNVHLLKRTILAYEG